MARTIKDAEQRHAYAKKGCTLYDFASKFSITVDGARWWLKRHNYVIAQPVVGRTAKTKKVEMRWRDILGMPDDEITARIKQMAVENGVCFTCQVRPMSNYELDLLSKIARPTAEIYHNSVGKSMFAGRMRA